MRIRFTPLNLVSSALLVSGFYFLIFGLPAEFKGSSVIFIFLLAIICFVSDLIFRRKISELKRIWFFEILFIIFVALIIALIRGMNQ
ncbi:MAG: hypothetical protein ABI390_07435 [Daejeonella sp.]